jgi:competence protein ComEA
MKKFLKDYFTFSKKESIIAIIILVIIAFFLSLPYYYSYKKSKEPVDSSLVKLADSILAHQENIEVFAEKPTYKNYDKFDYSQAKSKPLHPFPFNPNTLDENGFLKIGLNPKLIKTILNYRSKGGSFRKPDDFRKIWGLKKEDADILVPFITIENNHSNFSYPSNQKNNTPKNLDVNSATIDEYKHLPIPVNMAYKIFNYREKLGGFISIEQIKETYGLTDSLYQLILPYLKLNTSINNKLNINSATEVELSKHPYISFELAKAIVYYRNKYGNFKTINDIKKIVFVTDATFKKIAPYLTVEDQ